MSEKVSEVCEMRSEAAVMLRSVAEPKGNTKATIASIARRLGWKASRTKSIWYREARRIDGHEILALQAEYARVRQSVDGVMAALVEANPNLSREEIGEALRRAASFGRQTHP